MLSYVNSMARRTGGKQGKACGKHSKQRKSVAQIFSVAKYCKPGMASNPGSRDKVSLRTDRNFTKEFQKVHILDPIYIHGAILPLE